MEKHTEYFVAALGLKFKAFTGSNIISFKGSHTGTGTKHSRTVNIETVKLLKEYTPIKAGYFVLWGFPFSEGLDFHVERVANTNHPPAHDMYYVIAKEGVNLAELEYSTADGRQMRLNSFDFDFKDKFIGCYQAEGGTSAFSYYLAIDIV